MYGMASSSAGAAAFGKRRPLLDLAGNVLVNPVPRALPLVYLYLYENRLQGGIPRQLAQPGHAQPPLDRLGPRGPRQRPSPLPRPQRPRRARTGPPPPRDLPRYA